MTSRVLNKVIKTFLIVNTNLHIPSYKNQEKLLKQLITQSKHTSFGRKYGFEDIKTVTDFQKSIPLFQYSDYEQRITYMLKGEPDIAYPGKIEQFAISGGTTGKSKYVPVTNEYLKKNHFKGAMEGLSLYVKNNPRTQFFKGQGLVVGGSFSKNPYTGEKNVGFISAILQKKSPRLGQYFREPKEDVSYIENWEEKVQKIIEHTIDKNITFINGQPAWCYQLLTKLLESTGKKSVLQVRKDVELFFWGGMAIDLYREQFERLMPGKKVKYYQMYNASEGFFGVQDRNYTDDMLLLTNHGVFYEFIPMEEYGKEDPKVLTLDEVEIDKEYALVITNCSGLRRYIIGDTVKFTSLKPRRIKITGRTKYFIDVASERLTMEHTEKAITEVCNQTGAIVVDYTVGPSASTTGKLGHEWIIEFLKMPEDLEAFIEKLDVTLGQVNMHYHDEAHITKTLQKPIVHAVPEGTFYRRLKSKQKLGGQHKIPKLSHERKHIEEILAL